MRGLVLGTVAGAMYLASRRTSTEPPRLIEWDRVRRMADDISRREDNGGPTPHFGTAERYRSMVRQSEDVIGSYLKQTLPLPLEHVEVFDRSQWIDANIASFQLLFEPLQLLNRHAFPASPPCLRSVFEPLELLHRDAFRTSTLGTHLVGELNQTVLSGQLGILMGYLARRVLGQYDTALLGKEPVTTGRLYFVEPNIAVT